MTRKAASPVDHAGDEPAARLSVPAAEGGQQLAVQFYWQQDRFAHCLELASASSASDGSGRSRSPESSPLRFVCSVEGDPTSDWPPSPPFQQLDQCLLAADRIGLVAVGMAGTSHYSLAVEVERSILWFDVACRLQRAGASLGSTYRVADLLRVHRWDDANGVLELNVLGDDGAGGNVPRRIGILFDRQNTELLAPSGGREFQLRPTQIPQQVPATARWRYGITCDWQSLRP